MIYFFKLSPMITADTLEYYHVYYKLESNHWITIFGLKIPGRAFSSIFTVQAAHSKMDRGLSMQRVLSCNKKEKVCSQVHAGQLQITVSPDTTGQSHNRVSTDRF